MSSYLNLNHRHWTSSKKINIDRSPKSAIYIVLQTSDRLKEELTGEVLYHDDWESELWWVASIWDRRLTLEDKRDEPPPPSPAVIGENPKNYHAFHPWPSMPMWCISTIETSLLVASCDEK